jgi:hypothetical protein
MGREQKRGNIRTQKEHKSQEINIKRCTGRSK